MAPATSSRRIDHRFPSTESIAGSGHEIIEREQFDTSFAVCPTDEGATKCHYMTLLAEHENERSQSTRLNDA